MAERHSEFGLTGHKIVITKTGLLDRLRNPYEPLYVAEITNGTDKTIWVGHDNPEELGRLAYQHTQTVEGIQLETANHGSNGKGLLKFYEGLYSTVVSSNNFLVSRNGT